MTTKKFEIRTMAAGCEVGNWKTTEEIAKGFKSFRVTGSSDKSVYCEIDEADYANFVQQHAIRFLDYVIEEI